MGIFSSDNMFDATHRRWHRNLFNNIWKDDRVCTLSQFLEGNLEDGKESKATVHATRRRDAPIEACELIYTFVTGSNLDPDGPTELLDDSGKKLPIETPGGRKDPMKEDINWPDVTHLNIKENMNEGKSQTWMYFGSRVAARFKNTTTPIDYVVKFDSDSMLKLHDYFHFANTRLPPHPYNVNIFAGAIRDKGPWYNDASLAKNRGPTERARYESHWGNEYDGVHLYVAGQCYIMSTDLAEFVAGEAPFSRFRVAAGGYLEGHEDHDVSAMAYHSPKPINLITVGKSQRFWEHPVKGAPRYLKIVKRETYRMNGTMYEGKILDLY